jgi:hypothetical protein
MEVRVALEGGPDCGYQFMLGFADVEGAEVDPMLGFGDFILRVVSDVQTHLACGVAHVASGSLVGIGYGFRDFKM